MAVKIKLKRLGKIRAPYYRIVVADARTKRDGRAIEEIGKYHPKAEPSFIEVNSERAQHWLSVGAQPTDPVRKILEITGDWQKFRGLPGTEGTLKTAAPKEDRKEIFAAAVKETLGDAAAAPKGRARSSAARDAESSAKGGKAAAKDSSPARAEKPARARAKDAETKSAEPKSAEPKSAEAKSADAKSADAKSADAKSGDAKSGAAKGSAAKGSAQDKAGDAADGAAGAEAPDAASAAAEPAARTADAESASGD